MNKLIGFSITHPIKTILLSLLLIVFCASGLRYFYIESDYEVFFDDENARLQAHQRLDQEYGRKDGIRVGLVPENGDVFDVEVLTIIEELTEAFWQIPYSNRIESLTNFQYARDVDGELETSDLFEDPANLTQDEILERKQFALTDPAVVNTSVNPEGTVSGLIAYVTLPEKNPRATREIVEAVDIILAEFEAKYSGLNFYVTGSVPTNFAFFSASTKGFGSLVGMMLLVGLSLLALLLRSWAAIVSTFVIILGSVFIGLGLASWLRLPFTAFSSNAVLIIITVVIANTVHIFSAVNKRLAEGQTKESAITDSLKKNLQPIGLTSLTTTIGLLCLNFSDVPPSRFLGTTSALGVIGAFTLAYSLLPALLTILPIRARSASSELKIWDQLSDFVLGNMKLVAGVLLLVVVVSLSFIPRNQVNDSVLTYFDESLKFRTDTDYLIDNLFFYSTLDISIPSGEENGVNSPEYLRNLGKLIDWLEEKPEVYTVQTYAHTMKNLNRSMHDGDQAWWKFPEDRELASQYMLLYEMSLPFGFDMSNLVNGDKSASRMIVGFRHIDSQELIAFDQKLDDWINQNFPDEMKSKAGGASIMFANIWGDAAKSNLTGMLIAIALISVIIALAMRSVSLGALSLLPNLLPGLTAFGIWGFVSGRIDMGASVVAIITFGIVVDDTIHFISKFRYAFMELKYSSEQAVRYAMSTVGEAITITTLVLISGFAILAQSSFTLTANMGKLTCILLFCALILDLFLLPILLNLLYRNKRSKELPMDDAAVQTAK